MRSDMTKIVTERGARNRNFPAKDIYDKFRKFSDETDDTYRLESMSKKRRFGYDARETSINLSPLEDFLRKNIYRLWNAVYSDLSECKSHNIRKWISWLVEQHITIIDDKPYASNYLNHPYDGFYVHPESGILCHRKRDPRIEPEIETTKIPLDDNPIDSSMHFYRKENGVWYEFVCIIERVDLFTARHTICESKIRVNDTTYDIIRCAKKRQCSKKQLKSIAQKLNKDEV